MHLRRPFAFVATAFLAATFVHAQVAGRLSGLVVDQSGAAVPGAAVNVYLTGGKEPLLKGETNETGQFSFVTVRPDTYDVSVEAKGFTRVVVREVKVAPVQETSLAAIKLELQSTTTTVEVASDVQAVQLSNAEVSSTITSTQVQNLPVLGRQVSNLFQTQAGVSSGNNTTNVNGLRPSFSNVTLDGVNIQDNFSRTNDLDYAPMRTTIDQIAEITAATANPNITLGGGASQFVLSTKSGSNDFHGSVYWYNRNSALAANDWFNNQSGTEKSRLNLNQPGVALGGRIIRDKLFFYTNYEWFRDKEQSSRLRTVLTDSARTGVYKYRDSSGVVQSVNLTSLRGFSIDPTIKGLIDQLPAGNTTGTGDGLNTTGYRFNARSNEFRDQFVFKGDYYLNSKHSFSGTYNYIDNPTDRPDIGAFFTTVPAVTNTIRDHLVALSWRWTASPALTNELRGGFLRSDTAFIDGTGAHKFIPAGLVFSSPLNTFLNQGRKTNTYHFQDNATWVKEKHQISFGFQSQFLRISPFNDAGIVPTYTFGISAANTTGLTAADLPGIRSSDLTIANNLYANLAGIISSASQTFNVTSATSGFVPGATNLRQLGNSTHAAYVQDKWRLRSNLTVNLGVRYEYWTPMDEKNGLYLAPRLQNNDPRASVLDPNAVLDFIGGPSGRKFYNAQTNNVGPNVGFAWDPFKKGTTSVRGGYSISFVNDNNLTTYRSAVAQSSGLGFANTASNLTAFLASPPTVSAPVYKVPRTLADNFAITTSSYTGLIDPNLRTPYVHQWNLGIEHDFRGTIVAVRYIGNRGSSLLRMVDYNQVLYNANGFLADFQRAQSNARLSQAAGGAFNGSYNASIPGSQPLTVFPLLGNANLGSASVQQLLQNGEVAELANTYMINRTNGSVNFWPNPNVQGARVVNNSGFSNYHAAQIEVTRRTRSGLQGQFSYTFGKALGNTAGDSQNANEALLDNNNPSLEYARSAFDLRHVFKANFYYELPYGKGKHWSGNRVMNGVLGGWALSGIWSYSSGSPYSILSGFGTLNRRGNTTEHVSDVTNTASVHGDVPNLNALTSGIWKTGDTVYFIDPSVINPDDGRGAASPGSAPFPGQIFFNPGPGEVGNLQRRMFSGPWEWAFDASIKKSFIFRERHHLDLHFDMFNFMNHPTFYLYPATGGDYALTSPVTYTINSTSFGQVTDMNFAPRIIQIGAYYRF